MTLLDELVQPTRPVTDYNTRYSGITAALLATATLTAAEVRGRVLALARGGGGAGGGGAGAESGAGEASAEDGAGAEGVEGGGEAENCFLVGHSLENDLRSLELAWPRVLDTALLYPLKHRLEGPPAKARCLLLATYYLLLATCYLPPTTYYPLPNAYHLLYSPQGRAPHPGAALPGSAHPAGRRGGPRPDRGRRRRAATRAGMS